jgi:hypothetical protein
MAFLHIDAKIIAIIYLEEVRENIESCESYINFHFSQTIITYK